MSEASTQAPPLVPFLKVSSDGKPFLSGVKCQSCGHTYVGERSVCAKCTARNQMEPVQLADTGKVYSWSIVHRSFPGIKTPFIDVIVDLDDGAHIKGVLEGIDATPEAVKFDQKVKLAFKEAVPVNANGKAYLTYFFTPA
jgi:uncharacterized OB-fold protein